MEEHQEGSTAIGVRVRRDDHVRIELPADGPTVDRDLADLRALAGPLVGRADEQLQPDDDDRREDQQREGPPCADVWGRAPASLTQWLGAPAGGVPGGGLDPQEARPSPVIGICGPPITPASVTVSKSAFGRARSSLMSLSFCFWP